MKYMNTSLQILLILRTIWKHAGRLRPFISNTAVDQHSIDANAFCGACEQVSQTRGNSEEKRQRQKPSKVKSLISVPET